jgi:hypothetical protein
LDVADERQRRAVALLAGTDTGALATARAQLALTQLRRRLAGRPVDQEELEALLEEADRGHREASDPSGRGTVAVIQAMVALADGRPGDARAWAERAQDLAVAGGDRFIRARAHWVHGVLAEGEGDLDAAYRHVERGLRLLDQLGMRGEVTAQATRLMELAERRGEVALAEQWQVFIGGGRGGLARHDALLVASSRNAEGRRARAAGDLARARRAHEDALAVLAEAAADRAAAATRSALGVVAAELGDRHAAAEHHRHPWRRAWSAGSAA